MLNFSQGLGGTTDTERDHMQRTLAFFAALAAAGITLGCSNSGSAASSSPIAQNARPASCNVSPSRPGDQYSSQFGNALAYGSGPVYAMVDGYLAQPANGWRVGKILWIAKPSVAGTVTVTGKELDQSGAVDWDTAADRLVWEATQAGPSSWSFRPSNVYVRNPGCFELDVATSQAQESIVVPLTGGP
jgi:hypothetical protein